MLIFPHFLAPQVSLTHQLLKLKDICLNLLNSDPLIIQKGFSAAGFLLLASIPERIISNRSSALPLGIA